MNATRFISVFTSLCFLFSVLTQNVYSSYNNKNNFISDEHIDNFSIPDKFGKVTEINDKNGIEVINIQDLHSNYSAQISIKNILNSVDSNYNIKKIFIEGGYGTVDVSWLNKIKDNNFRETLIERLLLTGRLTGAEYFSYKNKKNNILIGLEDKEVHKQNLERLSRIIDKQDLFNFELKKIGSDIDFLNSKYLSKENLYLNNIIKKYGYGNQRSVKFYSKIVKLINKVNSNPKKYNDFISVNSDDFKNINRYLKLYSYKLNDDKTVKELKEFLSLMKNKMSYSEYICVLEETNDFSDRQKLCFYIKKFAGKYGINLSYYPSLYKYMLCNNLVANINPIDLVKEERILLNNLRQAFSKNNTEYEISFLNDFFEVFCDYLKNKMTFDNYGYFVEQITKFKSIYSKYAVVDRLKFLEDYFGLLNEYYAVNNLRNEIFLKNIFKSIDVKEIDTKKKEIIVVISGGFHTRGLNELLKENGIGYITITPNISTSIKESDKFYKSIIREQTKINYNALSFTIASSVVDTEQFNNLIKAAIEISGGTYSKNIIENIVEQIKPVVKENVNLKYSDKRTIISLGDKDIVLENINGKIQNIESKNISKPVQINTAAINELFERYPSLNFSDGLIFELRNADRYVTEINGFDLAVIARMPEIIQKYFYNRLSEDIKEKINKQKFSVKDEKVTIGKKIKKWSKRVIVSLFTVLVLSFGIASYVSPNDLTSLISSNMFAITNLDLSSEENYYESLLETKMEWTDAYMPSMDNLYYTYLWKYQLFQMENKIADSVDKILTNDNLSYLLHQAYTDNEIEYLKILSNRNDREKLKSIINNTAIDKYYRFYAHMLLIEDGYKEEVGEFDDLFNEEEVWQWIHDSDAEQEDLTDFEWQTKCYVVKKILGIDVDERYIIRFARLIRTGDTEPDIIARSDLSYGDKNISSGIWSTTAHEIGHNDMSNKLRILEILTSSPIRELYAYSYETLFSLNADIESGIYSRQALISVDDSTEEHDAGRAIIMSVINNLGEEYSDMLAESIIDYYRSVPINKSVREETIGILNIFIDKVIDSEISENKTTEQGREARSKELMSLLMRYKDYFDKYIDINNNNEQIKNLSEYIYSTSQNIQNEKDFFETLFDIKIKMTTDPKLIPATYNQEYLSRWNAILNRLNETIVSNINQIKNDKDLNVLLEQIYTKEDIEYIEIYNLSFNKDTKALENVISGNKDINYRFYANMIFMQKNRKEQGKYKNLFSEEEIVEYLKNYSDRNPQMTEISNFDWQVLCGMIQTLYGDKLTIYNFDTVFSAKYDETANYIKVANPNPYLYQYSLSYIKDKTTNPVLVAVTANQLYNVKNSVISPTPHVLSVRNDLTQLYIDVCLTEVARDLSIDINMDTKTNLNIKDIQDETSITDLSKIILNEIIKEYGYESLSLLRQSIYEYIKTGGEVYSALSDIRDILNSSAGGSMTIEDFAKETDKYIQENELSEETKKGFTDFISRFFNGRTTINSRDYNTSLTRYDKFLPTKKSNVEGVMEIFYKKLEEASVLSKENIVTKLIDKIKNKKIRKEIKSIYAVQLAPLMEASIINKIYYEKDEIKKQEKKTDFLNGHKRYKESDKEIKNKYEEGTDFILERMDDVYKRVYAKTHIEKISKLAVTISNIKYHKQWNRENLINSSYKKQNKSIFKKILISFLIFMTIITSVFTGIYIQKNYNEHFYSGYENSYVSHIKRFGDIFDVDLGKMSESERNKTTNLENYVDSVVDKNGEENFYQSLLEIRKQITIQETELMPSISNEDSRYMNVWRKLITYIDKTVAYNIVDIEHDAQLNILLQETYGVEEIEYLKILSISDENKLINIINDDNTDLSYRFFAYMVLKANGYNERGDEFADLTNKNIIYEYLIEKYTFKDKESDSIKFINVNNSFDWQVLCGMMNFILNAEDEYTYILENGRIVEAEADSDGINAMAKSNLLYAHVSSHIVSNANESPVLIAVHEMAHRRQNNTFGYLSNVMELYAYTVENIIGEDMGIEVDYRKKSPVYMITNKTETHDVGNIMIESIKRVTGVETLIFLEESIVEYVNDGSNKNATQVQMVDSILNIFVTKIVDNEIAQGSISSSEAGSRYNEIIVDIYGYNNFIDSIFVSENEARFSSFDKDLKEYLYSVFTNINNKEDFFSKLLEIRKEMSDNKPTVSDSSTMWRKTIIKIDNTIGLNIEYLENSQTLKKELESVYDKSDLEYMKIYVLSFEDNTEELEKIITSDKDINYRFYAYMIFKQKNRKEQGKYDDLFAKNEMIEFLNDYDKTDIKLKEINDYDWQVLCGMTRFLYLYEEKWDIYSFDNIFSLRYDNNSEYRMALTENSYIYQNSLNYIKDKTKNPVLVAIVANELYNVKNSLTASTVQITGIRDDLTELYIDACLFEASRDLSIPVNININAELTINDINNNTSAEEISAIVLNEIINEYGYDSVEILRKSIYEYMASGGPIYSGLSDILSEINANGGSVTVEELNNIVNKYIEEKGLSGKAKEGVLDFISGIGNNKTSVQSRDYTTSLSRYNKTMPDKKLNIEEVMNIFENYVSQSNIKNNKITNDINYDKQNFTNNLMSQFISVYANITNIMVAFLGIKRKDVRQIMAIYKEISVNQITYYTNHRKKEKDSLYENVFIVKDKIGEDSIAELKFKPLGIKVNGSRVFVSDKNGAIFIYSDNCDFDDLVTALRNNSLLKRKIIKCINSDFNAKINFDTANVISAKITSKTDIDVKVESDLITVSDKYGSYDLIELLSSYTDVMTRQGFIVKENLFRYIDDFDVNLTKEDRKKQFVNILRQKTTGQLVFDFDTLKRIDYDFGEKAFRKITEQLKEQNVKIYVFVSDKNKIKDIAENKFVSGYILFDDSDFANINDKQENMKCKIFDSLTCDEFEATFVSQSNSNTCSKIISLLNANVLKRPMVFRNSSIKEAVSKQRDMTIYDNFKSIFDLGKINAILPDMRSEYNSKKLISTYTVKELAASFKEQDIESLLKLYKETFVDENSNSGKYNEIIKILMQSESLNKLFEVSDKSKIKNLDLFIENIIFRIKAANVLKQQDKDMGLKNRKYEEILAKALKVRFINNFEDMTVDSEVLKIAAIKDQLAKEKTLKRYIEDNIINLTQKAFNEKQPDSVAINTIIFLMPYAETADILIDVTNMHIQQYDLRLTKNILSTA